MSAVEYTSVTNTSTISQSEPLRRRQRLVSSTLSVVAGFVATAILSVGTDEVLYAIGVLRRGSLDDYRLQLLELVYRSVCVLVGGFITGSFAPSRPVRHALIYGALGFAVSTVGVFVARDLAPIWYSLALVVSAFPLAWLGGELAVARRRPLRRR